MPQTGSGDPCPALSEDETCTDNCPVDCVLEEWSEWSTCDKACGGGLQSRSRDVVTPAANTGAPCGDLEEGLSLNSNFYYFFCFIHFNFTPIHRYSIIK